MNNQPQKTKTLTAGILSIVSGFIQMIGSIGFIVEEAFVYIIILMLGIAVIVLGILLCCKQLSKPLMITQLVLVGVLNLQHLIRVVIPLESSLGYYTSIYDVAIIFTLTLIVIMLAINLSSLKNNAQPLVQYHNVQAGFAQPSPEVRIWEREKKIESLKKLLETGELTQEEYKSLLLKELEK